VLRRPDVANIAKHYWRSPSSGFFILEYAGNFVGLIAIDASKDSQLEDTLMVTKNLSPSLRAEKQKDLTTQGTSSVATIRHFYIDEPYRTTGIQEDLLAHAIQHAFKADGAVKEIKATTTSLLPYTQKCLHNAGFLLEKHLGRLGIYKWKIDLVVLRRTYWEQQKPIVM
jgi:GNAT superfamily N-acetyltransferase